MSNHRHKFKDDGINIIYCVNDNNGKFCEFAKDKETGKVGKFVVIKGQGFIPC